MKIPSSTWLSGAAILFAVGLMQSSSDLVFVSGIVGAIGLGVRVLPLKERRSWLRKEPQRDDALQLNERVRLAEEELCALARELDVVKQRQEFDLQLRP